MPSIPMKTEMEYTYNYSEKFDAFKKPAFIFINTKTIIDKNGFFSRI